MTINPYQPATQAEPIADWETPGRLCFDGVIEREDYAALLPNGQCLWCLQGILLLLLMPTLVLGICITSAIFFKDGPSLESLVTFLLTLALLALAAFTAMAMGRGWRSRRYLAQFTDLLGVARGEFTEHGLLFHDGKRQHWFGPSIVSKATVSKDGVRVPLSDGPYRYLALTQRLFLSFSVAKACGLMAIWKKKAEGRSHAELHPVANLWSNATELPDGAVAFKGYCSTNEPMRTAETRQRAMIETFVAVGILAAAFAFANQRTVWFWTFTLYALFSGYASVQSWRQYFYGFAERCWYQYGWVSATQLTVCVDEMGTMMDWADIVSVDVNEDAFALSTGAQSTLFLFREHVGQEWDWERLRVLIGESQLNRNGLSHSGPKP